MGTRFYSRAAGQHPDLSGSSFGTDRRSVVQKARGAVLVLLAVDGALCAIFAVMLLPLRIGTVPAPISAFVAGLVNMALVWVGLQWTSSLRVAATALWAWLLTVALLSLGGPGGDIMFSGMASVVALLVLGAGPPTILLWRRRYDQLTRG